MAIRQNILIFKLLSHFIVVVEHRQLKGASEFLGLKQSNLSREMRDLEDMVGKKLFFRSSHGIEVTPDGQKLYTKSVDCINNIPKVLDDFKVGTTYKYITVRAPSATLHTFHRHLDDFQAKHPNISCRFTTDDIANSSAFKEIDVCITYMPETWQDVDVIGTCSVPFTLVTTQKYIDKYGIPTDANDLYENHRIAVCSEYIKYDKMKEIRLSRVNHLEYQVSNYEMLHNLLLEKNLIACIPSYMVNVTKDIVPIDVPGWELHLPLKIITSKEKSKIPHIFSMCELLASLYKKISETGLLEDMYINPKYDFKEEN